MCPELPLELVPALVHGAQICAHAPTKGYVQTGAREPGRSTKSERGGLRTAIVAVLNACLAVTSF